MDQLKTENVVIIIIIAQFMTQKKIKRVKSIKAWAIFGKEDDYFFGAGRTKEHAVITRDRLYKNAMELGSLKIIPVKIIFTNN